MTVITVIIPVLNEAANLAQTLTNAIHGATPRRLPALGNTHQDKGENVEIIVVDGGSSDQTVAIALSYQVKVIKCNQPGRAKQMNTGAAIATGEILLFLHGDTLLPSDYANQIREIMTNSAIVGGAFSLAISGTKKLLPWVAKVVNWRSRFLAFPYGDQGIFLRKSTFLAMGGFPDLPIMEDFEFILHLRKKGKIAIIPSTVITSGRRWQKLGILKTTIINQLVILGYFAGVKPEKLARFYRNIQYKL